MIINLEEKIEWTKIGFSKQSREKELLQTLFWTKKGTPAYFRKKWWSGSQLRKLKCDGNDWNCNKKSHHFSSVTFYGFEIVQKSPSLRTMPSKWFFTWDAFEEFLQLVLFFFRLLNEALFWLFLVYRHLNDRQVHLELLNPED